MNAPGPVAASTATEPTDRPGASSVPTGPSSPAGGGRTKRPAKRRTRAHRRRARFGITAVDRVNRWVLGLLAATLLAVGAIAILAQDRLDIDPPARLYRDVSRNIIEQQRLSLAIVIGAALLIIVLGLRLAWAQVSPASGDGRVGTTTLGPSHRGTTTLAPVSAAKALASDIETIDEVSRASVRVTSIGSSADLIATIDLRRDASLKQLRHDLELPLERFGDSTGSAEVEAEIRFRVADETAPRVR